MEFGCGGLGLRTSNRSVVNLYFWHVEPSEGGFVRAEDFLGRADSHTAKQELLRRMVAYDRALEERLKGQRTKLERQLARLEAGPRTTPRARP